LFFFFYHTYYKDIKIGIFSSDLAVHFCYLYYTYEQDV